MRKSVPCVRVLGSLPGIAFLVLSVLLRYAPHAVRAYDGRLFLGLSEDHPWLVLPVWAVVAAGLALLFVLVWRSWTVQNILRREWHARGRAGLAIAAVLLVLTLLPLPYSQKGSADQGIIVYLVIGSLGVAFLLSAVGSGLDFAVRPLLRLWDSIVELNPAVFALGAGLFVFIAANVISLAVFGHAPRIHDNAAQLFQARLFAQGRLSAPSPPLPQFFDMMLMVNSGRWYSQYPPGHPLILALGVLAHAPWLINPLLGALTVVLVFLLGRELYDERTARLATVLAAFSPFLILISAQYMNHASSLFFTVLFIYLYMKCRKRIRSSSRQSGEHRRPADLLISVLPLIAGLSLGMVVFVRPYTGLLVALPFVLDAVHRLVSGQEREFGRYALMALGVAILVGLLMAYNHATNGNPFELGYIARYGPGHGVGIGRTGYGTEPYTLGEAIRATSLDLNAVNRCLLEFPIPALLLVALAFLNGRARREEYVLLGVFVALVAGHFFYWWHDLLFGPRWEYEALPALVLLAAHGTRTAAAAGSPACRTQDSVASPPGISGIAQPASLGRPFARLFLICYLSVFAVAVPSLIRALPATFGLHAALVSKLRRAKLSNAIVLSDRFSDLFLENRVPPGGNVVYAKDLGPLDPVLSLAYPGRRFYYADEDTMFEIPGMSFDSSDLKTGLEDIVNRLQITDVKGYRCIFWPVAELESMIRPVETKFGLKMMTYRQLDQLAVGRTDPLQPYLPALAVRVIGDQSEDLVPFSSMDQRATYHVGNVQFRFVGISANGKVALYAIQ